MNNETHLDLLDLWQDQKSEEIHMSAEELRFRAGKLEKKIFWRNGREYVASSIVIVWFVFLFWQAQDALTGTGCGLIIAGMLYVMWQLHKRGSSRTLTADSAAAAGFCFYRRELERQRDMLRHVWYWYLGPLIPGLVTLGAAKAFVNPHHWQYNGWIFAGYCLLVAAGLVGVWRLNARAAERLQVCIDDLEALDGQGR